MEVRTKEIRPQEGMQEKMVRSNVDVCFAGGVLNPQPLTSKILTPSGFKLISEIKAGDEVCGIDNEKQYITHCDLEGKKECIRIVLEDGSSAESALDHKWWCLREGNEMTAISFELLESYQLAKEKGIDYDCYIFRLLEGRPTPIRIKEIIELGALEVACIGVSNEDELYITDDYLITKNCGKAQPLNAMVLTPKGYVRMGDLKEGDVICDTEGGTQNVIRIYEKGYKEVYRIEFDYGATECCGEHLWRVYDWVLEKEIIKTTHEIIASGPYKYSVICPDPIYQNLEGYDTKMKIDPYILGRLIGKKRLDSYEISDNMRDTLAEMYMTKGFRIPKSYLFAPVVVREQMLKGMLDEWRVSHSAKGIKVSLEPKLATYISFLVESLGGAVLPWAKVKGKDAQFYIRLPQRTPTGEVKKNSDLPLEDRIRRRIRKIDHIGKKPTRCILVSNPNHLYITDYYIPTHNTFAAILMVAEPSLDPNFRAVFTRRNLGNLKAGGGIVDDFSNAYGDYALIKTSDNPRIQFPSGSFVDCIHIADESPGKLMERLKGFQYDLAYMDELTSYEFTTFSMLGTRVRGKGKWTGKIRGTTNPKRKHWTRKMLDWYIGSDGFIMPERDGVVRYYYQMGETVDDVVFGDTKEEVYSICKLDIDKKLARLNGKSWSYKDMVRSFVFYSGKMSENKASVGHNSSYIGAVTAVGGRRAQQLIEGNFNVDEDEEDKIPIPSREAQMVFTNDEARNGDKWITVDLADVGSDNLVALYWDGFHVDDIMIISESTPKLNFERIKMFAAKHNVSISHVIYDATNGRYMYDYMPEAVPFISASSAIGIQALVASRLKDECYLRLADMIKRNNISISEVVARKRYLHKNLSEEVTVQAEFLEECSVVRFRELPGGRQKLLSKKEMNAYLGKGRSMDLLDPFAMRMLPIVDRPFGDERSVRYVSQGNSFNASEGDFDIFDDSNWY